MPRATKSASSASGARTKKAAPKPGGKAKAKAKSVAKAAAPVNAVALNEEAGNAPADAVVAHDIPHEDRPAKLRKLKRWGSAEHASRVTKDKLSGYNQLEIQSAVGKKTGMSVKDYI